jgi:hypothetical protein
MIRFPALVLSVALVVALVCTPPTPAAGPGRTITGVVTNILPGPQGCPIVIVTCAQVNWTLACTPQTVFLTPCQIGRPCTVVFTPSGQTSGVCLKIACQ